MSTDTSISLPRQRRIGPGLVLLFAFGVLLVALLLVVAWTWLASRRQLAAELERIRKSGQPVSAEDVEAFYEVPPDGLDCTKIWLAAVAPLDTAQFQSSAKDLPFVGEGNEPIPLPGEPWPQLDEAEQFLANHARSLEGMHRAARLGGRARFATRFADGVGMLLPHVQQLRVGVRLLSLETAVHGHRGRPNTAVDAVLAILAVARSLEQEPILVSQLVRMAVASVAYDRIQWLLSADILDDEQLARLDAALSADDYQQPFIRALIGERAIGLRTFADPTALGKDYALLRFAPFPAADEAFYLEVMAELIAAAEKTGSSRLEAVQQAELRIKQVAGTTGGRVRHPLTLLVLPSLTAFAESTSRREAQRDVTRLAIAIERFRQKHGQLPAKLDELVPEFISVLPDDPCNGKPLHYRISATEYLVYSVGTNGADDGGSDQPPERPADIVVRVPLRDIGAITKP